MLFSLSDHTSRKKRFAVELNVLHTWHFKKCAQFNDCNPAYPAPVGQWWVVAWKLNLHSLQELKHRGEAWALWLPSEVIMDSHKGFPCSNYRIQARYSRQANIIQYILWMYVIQMKRTIQEKLWNWFWRCTALQFVLYIKLFQCRTFPFTWL